jgi:hypothetical protein
MPAFNIQNFRAALVRDGARQNLFEVDITFPGAAAAAPGTAQSNFTFFCKAASLPPEEIGVVPVPYFGRQIKVPGNRTFPEWSLTVINDETFDVRAAFESWSNGINAHLANVRAPNAITSTGYASSPTVIQWSKDGTTQVAKYQLINAWPSAVSPQDLAWDANDQIEEFQVTMQYDYWVNAVSL